MSYQTIIDAIDVAIEGWVGKAVMVASPNGGSITYRSLDELIRARKYYERLVGRTSAAGRPRLGNVTAGGR